LPRWIFECVNKNNTTALREVVGQFVAIIDDRRLRRVRMISDVMGLRPWFVGRCEERLVCGSDIWAIQEAGLNRGSVNYDAVASWLRYAYDCTGQSLLGDFPHIGFGVVGTWAAGVYSEKPYAVFTGGDNTPTLPTLLENIHETLSRSFDAVTRELDQVQIALSGGYDSRYLAALAVERSHLKVEAFCICDREAEGLAASMVAEELGLSLQTLKTNGSPWNTFDDPYFFTAGGFPMTKQFSYAAASQRPGVPCLNGFLGDPMIRGTLDRIGNKLASETTEDLAVAFQRNQHHRLSRFDLIDGNIVGRCDERMLAVWRKQMSLWMHTGHQFAATSFFTRQRHYMANIFLQHLDITEAIAPFTAYDVIQCKLQNVASCFTWETYDALFRRYFPKIAHVPHNSKMGEKNVLHPSPSRCTKKWAARVLKALAMPGSLRILNRRKSIPQLIGALMGRRDLETVSLFAYRLLLLERRSQQSGVALDWTEI
jgi:hypothetical protein